MRHMHDNNTLYTMTMHPTSNSNLVVDIVHDCLIEMLATGDIMGINVSHITMTLHVCMTCDCIVTYVVHSWTKSVQH